MVILKTGLIQETKGFSPETEMCKSLSSKRKHASHCRKKITYKSGSENNIEIKKNMQIVVHSMFHCYNTDIVSLRYRNNV